MKLLLAQCFDARPIPLKSQRLSRSNPPHIQLRVDPRSHLLCQTSASTNRASAAIQFVCRKDPTGKPFQRQDLFRTQLRHPKSLPSPPPPPYTPPPGPRSPSPSTSDSPLPPSRTRSCRTR